MSDKKRATLLFSIILYSSSVSAGGWGSVMPKSRISVENSTSESIEVKVSKACEKGQDGWWTIEPGKTETWKRCIGYAVTIKLATERNSNGTWREEDSVRHTTAASYGCNRYYATETRLEYSKIDCEPGMM